MKTKLLIALSLIILTGLNSPAQTIATNSGIFLKTTLISTKKMKAGKDSPTFIFKLYDVPALSNFHYRLDIYLENGELLQSEAIRNGVILKKPDLFRIVDVNSDGYRDIKILGGYRKDSTAWFKIWLYKPSERKFVWSTALS